MALWCHGLCPNLFSDFSRLLLSALRQPAMLGAAGSCRKRFRDNFFDLSPMKPQHAMTAAGKSEIRPGQAKQLAFLRRLAPDFINRQLWKATKGLVPVGV